MAGALYLVTSPDFPWVNPVNPVPVPVIPPGFTTAETGVVFLNHQMLKIEQDQFVHVRLTAVEIMRGALDQIYFRAIKNN